MRRAVLLCLAFLALTVAGPAQAETEFCGYSQNSWNVSNGGAVFNAAPDPIAAVLSVLGEQRTHSMLSHGPGANGWVSHATMRPPEQTGNCGPPLKSDQLQYGYPGLEQVNQGGIYTFLYGDKSTSMTFLAYQLGNPAGAAQVANAVWSSMPFVRDPSKANPSAAFYKPLRNGARVPYSFYQYRDIEQTNQIPSSATNNGTVCSTFLAYAHAFGGRGVLTPYTYNHDQLGKAASSLAQSIYNSCVAQIGSVANFFSSVMCPYGTGTICDNAANQVVNCMATNTCNRGDPGPILSVLSNQSTYARSISPDRLGAWGAHKWIRDANNVWAEDANRNVLWNVELARQRLRLLVLAPS